ncbi:aspartate aminotransferase family protein [Streptomyces sp. SW4]|nr:aspartate aminotransferase family protein [Streptomyces sp. SW4]
MGSAGVEREGVAPGRPEPPSRTQRPYMTKRQAMREPSARAYGRSLPVVPVRARGLTVEGADGRRYLDCLSGAGMLALGHHHPVVLEAVRKVLDSGAPLQPLGLATPVEDAFVAELERCLPTGLAGHARVRFCGPSRTDALELAVRLARAAAARTRAGRDGGGGGGASGAGDTAGGTGRTAGSTAGRTARDDDGEVTVTDAWSCRVPRLTVGRALPLVVDESETGVGRTGAFWAVEHSGVTPDAMVLAGAIGGGLPLAVVVHRADLDAGDPGTDATGGVRGNQLAMAAGTATLAHIRENGLVEHASVLGSRMLARLRELPERYPHVGAVRGRGLMIGVELADPEDDRAEGSPGDEPGSHDRRRRPRELAAAVRRECLRRGLLVDVGGPEGNVVRLLPPLTVSEEQAAAVLDRLTDAVGAVTPSDAEGSRW